MKKIICLIFGHDYFVSIGDDGNFFGFPKSNVKMPIDFCWRCGANHPLNTKNKNNENTYNIHRG